MLVNYNHFPTNKNVKPNLEFSPYSTSSFLVAVSMEARANEEGVRNA
jgi:hypothetical protein